MNVSGQQVQVQIGNLSGHQTVVITIVTRVSDSVVPPATITNLGTVVTAQGTFTASATISVLQEDNGKLPDTGERPLWIRLAGPLALILLGVLVLSAAFVWKRQEPANQA